ncbi:MAG TPA: YfhO family protein, partial [Gemmatimonadaceae bacterium]|nr:YfhO family protein [Gemmatimonadaceae bacterium]
MTFEPKHPLLAATACFAVWIGLLSIPMLSGQFLAASYNDQYSSGYAYRAWAAEWWKTLGHVPLWNPEIFGGMPFVAGMHGDVLYPTAWLRLVMPTHVAMNLGFVIHYVLAALFTYWFLRRWRVSWTGAVVGGVAYQLAGVVGSYVSPGHDGKLFVTTMLPLVLTGLTLGIRDRRYEGYGLVALAVGLIMLSPHPQMAQYALLFAGLFALYLVFGEGSVRTMPTRIAALGMSAAAVVLGVGVSAIQYVPFYAYIPYSPRDASVLHDFAWSAAYAIPWSHVPELVVPRFTGETFTRSYWGPNGLKLHSEYLGLVAVALAAVGAIDRERRRMIVWLGAIGALFLLIALGGSTPFFRLWWEVVPFSKSMRAPGMALFAVAFVSSVLAAFGVDRVAAGSARRFAPATMVVGGVVAILGASGMLGALAEALGRNVEATLGLRERGAMGLAAARTLQGSAFGAGLFLAIAGAVTLAWHRRKVGPRVWSGALILLVGTDLWLNDKPFWQYSNAQDELFAGDAIKAYLSQVKRPFRVWDIDAAR